MKFRFTLFLLIISFSSFSQGALNLPDNNVLYRGYDNSIQLGAGNYKKKFIITGEGVSLTLIDSLTQTYLGRVSSSAKTAIVLVLSKNLRDTLERVKFRVANLPLPTLFLGNVADGEETVLDSIISCRYDDSKILAPTSVTFTILSYEIIIAGENTTYKGSGGIIPKETIVAIKEVLAKPREKEFLITNIVTTVKGADGVTRKKSGTFKLK